VADGWKENAMEEDGDLQGEGHQYTGECSGMEGGHNRMMGRMQQYEDGKRQGIMEWSAGGH
jgi:hypothetical protein